MTKAKAHPHLFFRTGRQVWVGGRELRRRILAIAASDSKAMRGPTAVRFLWLLPLALSLGGCIDSGLDLSASLPPAFPLAEGFYQAVNDPKSPPFKIVRSSGEYRAIDPKSPNGQGAIFALMDPDHTSVFIAEDKTSAKDLTPQRYVYYFVKVDESAGRVDLYDFTKADWNRLPGDLKKRLKPGAGVTVIDDADTAAILMALERRLAVRPTMQKTTFRLIRRLDAGEN
jgi:hypothetical protein